MSTIRLDISETQDIKKKIARIKNEISYIRRSVKSISDSIDMKVNARKNIDSELAGIIADLQKEYDFLEKCEKLIDKSINEFVAAEKIGHLPSVNFSVGAVGTHGIAARDTFNSLFADSQLSSIDRLLAFLSGSHGLVNATKTNSLTGEITEFGWSKLKTLDDIISFVDDGAEMLEGIGGIELDGLEAITDSKLFDVIGFIKDITKIGNFCSGEGDMEDMLDLLGKYGIKKPVKELVKLAGESGVGASLVADFALQGLKSTGEITAETVLDVYNVMADPSSDWKDYAKCIESIFTLDDRIGKDTLWNVIGSKAQDMVDIFDGVGVTDFGSTFEEFTGIEDAGIVDFYETAMSDVKNMFEHFGSADGAKLLLKNFGEVVTEDVTSMINDVKDVAGMIGNKGFGYTTQLLVKNYFEVATEPIADIGKNIAGWIKN